VALTTVDAVNVFLESDNDERNAVIQSLIAPCSQAIENYTHREFTKADDEERVFAHPGGLIFDLAPYDLRSVESIATGTDTSTPTLLAAADYALRPLPARHGVYLRIKLARDPGPCEITVSGDWGFEKVPEDIANCAISTIALWMRREVTAFERSVTLDEERLERPEALPSAIRGRLAPWRRPKLP